MPFPRTPPLHVEVAFGQDINAINWQTVQQWTDLSDRLRTGTVKRGRDSDLTSIQAATGRLTLDNRDGELTPGNTGSSWFPNVEPMTPIRITANTSASRIMSHAPKHFWPLTEPVAPFQDYGSNPMPLYKEVDGGAGNGITARGGALPCPAEGAERAPNFIDGGSSYSRLRTEDGAGNSVPLTDVDLTSNFHFSAWIDLDTNPTHPDNLFIASHRYPIPELWYLQIQTDGDLAFVAWDTIAGTHSLTYAAGLGANDGPTHVAVNYDFSADHLEMYIDGVWVAEDTSFFGAQTPRTASNAELAIGQNGNTGARFDGRIAYVMLDTADISSVNVERIARAGQTTTEDVVADPTNVTQPSSVFHGFVERWSPRWPQKGSADAVVDLELVDQMKLPVLSRPPGFYPYEIRAHGADHHWRMEGAGDTRDWITGREDLLVDAGGAPDTVGNSPIYDTNSSVNCDQSVANEHYNAGSTSPTSGAASWEIWFAKSGAPATALFPLEAGQYTGTFDMAIYIDTSGRVTAAVAGTAASPIIHSSSTTDGSWHHVVLTFDGTNQWELYVDASNVGSKTDAHSLGSSTLYVGRDELGGSTSINLAEAAVYNTELDADEIDAHYRAATGYDGDTPGQRIERFADFYNVPATFRSFRASAAAEPDSGLITVDALQADQSMMEVVDGCATPIFGNFYIGRNGSWKWTHPLDRPSSPLQSCLTLWARRYATLWKPTTRGLRDQSLYRIDFTDSGNPAVDLGVHGFAGIPNASSWAFDGVNDAVLSNLTDVGTDATWFMHGWFYPDSSGSGSDMLMGIFTSGGADKFQIYYDHADEVFQFDTASTAIADLPGQTAGDSPADNWYMVTVRHDGNGSNESEWWLDGTSMGTFTASASTANNDRFRIGEEAGGGNDFVGNAHDVCFGAYFLPNNAWVEGVNRLKTALWTVSDASALVDFELSYDDSRYFNIWKAPNTILWLDHEEDRNRYGERVYNIDSAEMFATQTGFVAGAILQNVVGKLRFPSPRIRRARFNLGVGNMQYAWAVCAFEIDQRVLFDVTAPSSENVEWSGWVDSIQHDFSPGQWHVTLTLSP